MKLITRKMPNNFNLFLVGDDHIGNLLRYDKGISKLFDMLCSSWGGVSEKHNYVIHHGDMIEAICVQDKRFDPAICTEPIPFEQANYAIKEYEPIKNKLITILDGNHPYKLHQFGNLTKYICDGLGVEYGTWSSKVIFNDMKNKLMFKSFHTHGNKTINSTCDDIKRRKVNMKLSLKRALRDLCGDVALSACGHSHKLLVCDPEPELYMTDDGKDLKQGYTLSQYLTREFVDKKTKQKANNPDKNLYTRGYVHPDYRWYVNTGSFLKTFELGVSSYSERAGYANAEMGIIVVEVRDKFITNVRPINFFD